MIYIYVLLYLLIWWTVTGYYIILSNFCKKYNHTCNKCNKKQLRIAVIVPCYNEKKFIKEKIRNLKKVDYPRDLFNVYFLNGLSIDDTSNIIKKEIEDFNNFFLIETNLKGKIPQINYYLPFINEEIIIQSDVDGILLPDALKKFSDIFRDNKDVVLVGAYILPKNALEEELLFWEIQNSMRLVESKAGMSSVVIATCFAFRRDLLKEYDQDVIADDVFIAFKALSQNKRAIYHPDINVEDVRSASGIEEMFIHKLRKGNANMRELIRFFPVSLTKNRLWAMVYYTKFFQTFITPICLPAFALLSIYYLLVKPLIVFVLFAITIMSILISSRILRANQQTNIKFKFLTNLKVFVLLNLTLIINLFIYPFYRQSSSYKKVK